jgi:hypothetical protein
MRKSVFVIAVAAAACSGVALAGEVKQDKAQVVKAQTMSDAQMDKVTAGGGGQNHGDPQGSPQGWAWGFYKGGPGPAYVAFDAGFTGRQNK